MVRSNAFNGINRSVLLHNARITCPELSTNLVNFYILPIRLCVLGGKEKQSDEGTTQGDPVAIGVYAIGLIPLLTSVMLDANINLTQVAFADDLTGVGKIEQLKLWRDQIMKYVRSIYCLQREPT